MENCLTKEILFDYYHNELDSAEMQSVQNHIDNCEGCQHSIDLLTHDINQVKNTLKDLNPEIKEIPTFKIEGKTVTKKIELSKVLSWAAGICLFVTLSTLTTIKIIDNQKPVNDYEYFEYIPDMNDAWKDNNITVTSYDVKGNPVNHQVIKD